MIEEKIMQKKIENFWRGIDYCSKYLDCPDFDENECWKKEKECYV